MTGARTVTVHTLDAGALTIPEPAWCLGHPEGPAEYRADVHHTGPEHLVDYEGRATLAAELVEFPYGKHPVPASVYMGILIPAVTLDPPGLEALAAVLDEQAAELRRLALRLAVVRAGGDW